MSKLLKEIMIIILVLLFCLGLFLLTNYFNITDIINGYGSNKVIIGSFMIFIVITVVLIANYVKNIDKNKQIKYRDKLFNLLTKNSDTVYFMYDPNLKNVVYMSNNTEDVLGTTSTDKDNILNEIFEIPVLQNEFKSWNKKDEFISQMILYNSNSYQSNRWIKVKIYPHKEKKLEYYVILISDVTKEHDRQHLLVSQASDIKLREKQLNQITSISYDVEMDIKLSNETIKLNNLKESNLLGENCNGNYDKIIDDLLNKYVYEEDIKTFKEHFSIEKFNQLFKQEQLEPIFFRYRLKNEKVWLESTAFLSLQKGEETVTILTKDVTENAEYMRNQNLMLQNALKSAESANKSKTNFLSTVSHEIRSSMNAILGLSESVLNTELPIDIKDDIENINSASVNILEVIDNILDISKVEAGIFELREKEYNTVKLFKDVINVSKQNFDKKSVKFILNIDKEVPVNLYGDSSKIRQILLNLMEVLETFIKKGTLTFNISSVKNKNNTNLKINIIAKSPIIYPKEIEQSFNSDSDSGIKMIENLIDKLKGNLSIKPVSNDEINFELSLNQRYNNDEIVGELEEQTITRKKVSISKFKGKKILIVDDNKLDQKVASRLLKDSEVEISCVSSGDECIKLLSSNNDFDLILLDQMMPGMDGIETLSKLKEDKNFKIPVIMLTADAIIGKKEQYLKAGFNDYITKPIVIEDLNKLLKTYLNKED